MSVLLAIACVLLIGWAGIRASDALLAARTSKLFDAERAVVQATVPSIRQDRIPNRLVRSVRGLVADPALDLEFLTVRNANNVTLVSRGRLGETGGWLSFINSRALRSWFYRVGSAEANRPIMRDARNVGFAHFGVSWTSIMYRAGMPLFIWATALLAGVIGLFGLVLRLSSAPPIADAREPTRMSHAPRAARDKSQSARVPLSRFARGGSAREAEFAPIADVRSPSRSADAPLKPARAPAASPQASAAPPADLPAPEPTAPAQPIEPSVAPLPPVAAEPAAKPTPPVVETTPDITAVESDPVEAPASETPAVAFEAPRVDARPKLGDSTLDLRFYPIWRGGSDMTPVLAGACAALAWRTGEAELVDADTLTRLAEKDGALRAFTQWIARRFSLLHGNWRTLELNTVPIVLPIPSAMLAFADAEAVWRDALRRTDRDPNDLILRLDYPVAAADQASLPLRRALPVSAHDDALPADCDVLCVDPVRVNGDARDWCARFDALDRPVLFGPVADPAAHREILAHERVLWFSEREEDVHSPRSFARLLARNTPAPI
ncbi:hypothetical protein GCM10028792_11900 [Salinisphaera aquimarina]